MASPKSPVAAQEPKSDSPGGPAMDEETRRKTTEAVQSVAVSIACTLSSLCAYYGMETSHDLSLLRLYTFWSCGAL